MQPPAADGTRGIRVIRRIQGKRTEPRHAPNGYQAALPTLLLLATAVTFAAWCGVEAVAVGAQTEPTLTEDSEDESSSSTWIDADCRSCHQVKQPIFSHPLDVRPSMAVPKFLPLDQGRLGCTTCHANDPATHARSRTVHDGLLRQGEPGRAFCDNCHDSATSPEGSTHTQALDRAHLTWADRQSTGSTGLFRPLGTGSTASITADAGLAAAAAKSCRGCHDGASGPDVGYSHPTGIRYMVGSTRSSRPGKDSELATTSRLDSRIRLFDSKVECQSCHSPFSRRPKLLVMANNRDQLCRSCHNRH